jgi:hypothetical protein
MLQRRSLVILLFVLGATFVISCGGDSEAQDPTPTAVPINEAELRAIALTPEEAGVPLVSGNVTNQGTTLSYAAAYGDPAYDLRLTISHTADDVEREERFRDLRSSVNLLIGGEANYDLPDSELAFDYQAIVQQTPNRGVIILKDEFIILMTVASNDVSQSDRVFDEETAQRYVDAMFGRVLGFEGDTN